AVELPGAGQYGRRAAAHRPSWQNGGTRCLVGPALSPPPKWQPNAKVNAKPVVVVQIGIGTGVPPCLLPKRCRIGDIEQRDIWRRTGRYQPQVVHAQGAMSHGPLHT